MITALSSLIMILFVGIPFNDTNWRLEIAEYGQQILGNNLLGLQAGNEPDFYATYAYCLSVQSVCAVSSLLKGLADATSPINPKTISMK